MATRALQGLTSETLADQAYEALRAAIISGELASGEKITERGLAERLSVSPTPVREALRRLEQDRLVVRQGPRREERVGLGRRFGGFRTTLRLGWRLRVWRFGVCRLGARRRLGALGGTLGGIGNR